MKDAFANFPPFSPVATYIQPKKNIRLNGDCGIRWVRVGARAGQAVEGHDADDE